MTARTLAKTEKEAVWPVIVARGKRFASHQQRTTRDIPVVKLQPADGDTRQTCGWITACSAQVQQPQRTLPTAAGRCSPHRRRKGLQ